MTEPVAPATLEHEAPPRVGPGSFLTLHYRLAGPDGAVFVDTFGTAPATLSLGTGELAPAMEACLIGLEAGSRASFELPAGAVYGERSDELLQRIGRAALARLDDAQDDAGGYAVGDVVRFPAPGGAEGSIAGIVRAVDDDSLVLDFNHPLAGRPVRFDVHLVGVL